MRKIEEYEFATRKLIKFELETYEDHEKGEFVGVFTGYELLIAKKLEAGEPFPYPTGLKKVREQEVVRHKDYNTLRENCKKRITEIGKGLLPPIPY